MGTLYIEQPRRGDSNENSQSMFLSRDKKNNVCPCKAQFYYMKLVFKGSKVYSYVFVILCKNSKQEVGHNYERNVLMVSLHTGLSYVRILVIL